MLLTINQDTGDVVCWPGNQPLSSITLPRGPRSRLTVQFVSGGALVAVGTGTETGLFAAKINYVDSSFVFNTASPWAIVAATATTPPQYTFTLVTDTASARALLQVGLTTEQGEVTLKGSLKWTDGAGNTYQTNPFAIVLVNEVIEGGESSGDSTPPYDVLNWSNLTALTGGAATDLDAQATAGAYAAGTLVALVNVTDPATGQLVNAGGTSTWLLVTNTGGALVTGPGVVVPLDADPVLNNVAWVQKS